MNENEVVKEEEEGKEVEDEKERLEGENEKVLEDASTKT